MIVGKSALWTHRAVAIILCLVLACHALLSANLDTQIARSTPGESIPNAQDVQGQTKDTDQRDSSSSQKSSRRRFLYKAMGSSIATATISSAGAAPSYSLFEDIRKTGRCPSYEAVPQFDIDRYMGIWYELAYHDWTQIEICGCTRFNMTRSGNQILDAFTTKCPYRYEEGETFMINMHEEVDESSPGSFAERAFYTTWGNKVVALWRSPDAQGHERYERAIQFQCVEVFGRRPFVGINFLSRAPIVSQEELGGMFDRARDLGLAPLGGNQEEMVLVPHLGCRYPSSTDSSLRRERISWGSGWGVNKLMLDQI